MPVDVTPESEWSPSLPGSVPPPPRRRRLAWKWGLRSALLVYVVVIAASWITRIVTDRPPVTVKPTVTLPRFNDDGPLEGHPVVMAYQAMPAVSSTSAELRQGGSLPIVLIHGSPGDSSNLLGLAAALGQTRDRYSLDLPGFGQSSRYLPDYGIRAHARYTLAWMDELGIERAHFVGHSMGPGVIFHLADLAPDRVASVTSYGGIGVMESEGSGDFYFEQIKYRIGYALLVLGVEALPHFGRLGEFGFRHAWLRNFIDTDMRPNRQVMTSLESPTLILHGKNDPLVTAWGARQHHHVIAQSQLVMLDDSHFMVFEPSGNAELSNHILPFLEQVEAAEAGLTEPPGRKTQDPFADQPVHRVLPLNIELRQTTSPWLKMAIIAGATFIVEDPVSVAVGLLIRDGQLDLFVGLFALLIGIFLGDVGLYLVGRHFGQRVLRWKVVQGWLPVSQSDKLGAWFDRHGWQAIFASRFVPGTRLPLFIAAGAVGAKAWVFMLWVGLAVVIWTPAVVIAAIVFGETATSPIRKLLGEGWLTVGLALVVLVLAIHAVPKVFSLYGRAQLVRQLSRLWRWEFWPALCFYFPFAWWWAWHALRHGGPKTITAVNPSMPMSGLALESKAQIMAKFEHAPETLPSELIASGETDVRLAQVEAASERMGWPLILKPDCGQRGVGVRKVEDLDAARGVLELESQSMVVQRYDPGPKEIGVFFVREPGQDSGRIFSITDKVFPVLEGDGQRTLRQLILKDRRLRMQADTFLHRHRGRWHWIPEAGQRVPMAMAGNHAQGTLFRDGSRFHTPQLEAAIDTYVRHDPGFHFGRMDLRYADDDALRRGEGFAVVEVNGITSESTNMYDPSWPITRAYRLMAEQWRIAFAIGQANMAAGVEPDSHRAMLALLWRWWRNKGPIESVAD